VLGASPPVAARPEPGEEVLRFRANGIARLCSWVVMLPFAVLLVVLGFVSYPTLDPVAIALAVGTWILAASCFLMPSVALHENALVIVNPFHIRVVSRHAGLSFHYSSFLSIATSSPPRSFTAMAIEGSNLANALAKPTRVTSVAAELTAANEAHPLGIDVPETARFMAPPVSFWFGLVILGIAAAAAALW